MSLKWNLETNNVFKFLNINYFFNKFQAKKIRLNKLDYYLLFMAGNAAQIPNFKSTINTVFTRYTALLIELSYCCRLRSVFSGSV